MDNNQVLIIENDRSIAEYFQAVLTMVGMDVEIVLSARQGLVRLAGSAPALILLDMHLGNEIGGEDILYQIRSNPRFDTTRVIVITGYPNTVQMVSDLADLILIKPVGTDQLASLAQRMISFEVAPRGLAFRDPVTALFNLEFFYTRLELAFERARRRPDFLFAVIVFKVEVCGDDAALVNPSVDLSITLLSEIARRLKQNLRPTDTIARATGWKFVTLHEDLRRVEDVQIILDRIQNILAAPFQGGDDFYKVKPVFGSAVSQIECREPKEIYKAAEYSLEEKLASQMPSTR